VAPQVNIRQSIFFSRAALQTEEALVWVQTSCDSGILGTVVDLV